MYSGMDIYTVSCVSVTSSGSATNVVFVCHCYHCSSVQFKTVSMRLEKPICAPPRLSEVSPTLILSPLRALRLLLVL